MIKCISSSYGYNNSENQVTMKEGNKKQISIKIYLFWTGQQHVCVHVCNPSL